MGRWGREAPGPHFQPLLAQLNALRCAAKTGAQSSVFELNSYVDALTAHVSPPGSQVDFLQQTDRSRKHCETCFFAGGGPLQRGSGNE